MQIRLGGVTAAKGFQAASAAAEIKYKGRDDMAMVYSKEPCVVAGTFTKNLYKAAPVVWCKQIVESGKPVHAIVANSGVANACTGGEGLEYCRGTAEKASELLGIPADSVLLGSTGVIGKQMPMDKLEKGVELLAASLGDTEELATAAAKAIMTTDTKEKQIAVEIEIDGKPVTIGGMAKGSGMIHPDMCTMLAFITTDAVISQAVLQKALSDVVDNTYNMISVDRDTSTNDTCVVIANGLAGNAEIPAEGEDYETFKEALFEVNKYLAMAIAGDGEGCTCLFECRVEGAETLETAKTIAKSVVCSNLTKTAVAGHDANWGRILCAAGYSGAQFDPDKLSLSFESVAGQIQIAENGKGVEYSEEKATEILSQEYVCAVINLNMGAEIASAWGCDLTHAYIEIHADYRS